MLELWQSLPPEFRLPNPEDIVTVWRGDNIGKRATGMTCTLDCGDPEQVVMEVAEQGYEALKDLVDRHTSDSSRSPLVSVAADIRMAQGFAGIRDKNETIFEISMPAHRLLRDAESVGAPKWPKDSELFVVGAINPSDIKRFKVNNADESASELLFMRNGRTYIYDGITDIRTIAVPVLPNPLGIWENVTSMTD